MCDFPDPPKHNDNTYQNFKLAREIPWIYYGIREASRKIGLKSANSLVQKVKSNTIEHIIVNGRPFIPEYIIKKYLNKDYKIEALSIESGKISFLTTSFQPITNFVKLLGGSQVEIKVSVKNLKIEDWKKSNFPIEVLHTQNMCIIAKPITHKFKIEGEESMNIPDPWIEGAPDLKLLQIKAISKDFGSFPINETKDFWKNIKKTYEKSTTEAFFIIKELALVEN